MLPNDKLGEGWAAQRSGLQQDDVMGSSSALETIAATPGSNLTSQTGGIFMNQVTPEERPGYPACWLQLSQHHWAAHIVSTNYS